MPRTDGGVALVEAHRVLQAWVLARTVSALPALWAGVDPRDLRGTLDLWLIGATPRVLEGWWLSAASASRFYSALRVAEGFGPLDPPWPVPPTEDALRSALVGSAVRGVRSPAASTDAERKASGLVRVTGSVVSLVAGGGRDMVLGGVAADPEAIGYQRVTDGDPCAFCRMVASRGIIRYSAETAGFPAHAHCGCTAAPAFRGDRVSDENAEYRRQWQAATRGEADALKAFRRYLDGSRDGAQN